MITPETTVAQLGLILAKVGTDFRAIRSHSIGPFWLFRIRDKNVDTVGEGEDLITALNDALGKVDKS